MPDALNPSLLQRLMRPRRARREPDPADMGTAFGLEYILDHPAQSSDDDGTALDKAAPWWQRWVGARTAR
ncbi:hypothetical protein HLB44_21435 [Aquincola sp. S2]|uniref:Uncharacterized protein n=1 Tax=Pseudaquabacterium terrae TaxID=2732868 RepID=A0ABX2ELM2_9BURK|nr:hypothetical protein [Aquabacterium terrae]NRF69570.1 hypothetical protein [Aquabacterium terrae]